MPHKLQNLMRSAHRGVIPSVRLAHLVRAASPGGCTLEHWNKYVEASSTSFPDAGEIRLFPLVRYKLQNRQDGAANQSWLKLETDLDAAHSVKLNDARKYVEQLLLAADLPFLWTKGTALTENLYPDRALRPSSDLDLLMPWDSLPTLLALAKDEGWENKLGVRSAEKRLDSMRYRGSEVSWRIQGGIELDVGWMPRLPFAYDPFAINWLFASGAEDRSHFANPTWLLLEAIEHGLNANVVSPIRWVVDALWLIDRYGAEIDWDMFVELTKRYRLECLVGVGLAVLEAFTSAIPDTVFGQIRSVSVSAVQMDEFQLRSTTVDHAKRDLASMKYNLVLRAPAAFYAKHTTSPITSRAGVSLRLRGMIAARNLYARLVWPIKKQMLRGK